MARCHGRFAWLLHHENHILSQTFQIAWHQQAEATNNAILQGHLPQALTHLTFANFQGVNSQSRFASRSGTKKVEFAILKVKESDFALKVLSKKLRIMFEIRTRLCALLNSIFTRKSLLVNVQVTFKFAALRFEIRSSAKLNSRRSQTGDFRLRSLKAWISECGHNTTKPLKAKNVVVVVVVIVVVVVVGGGGGGGGAVAVALALALAVAVVVAVYCCC